MSISLKKPFVIGFVLLCAGCSQAVKYDAAYDEENALELLSSDGERAASLEDLKQLTPSDVQDMISDQSAGIRITAMREAALIVGAQQGYNARLSSLKKSVEKHEQKLDAIFDFRALMMLASNGQEEKYLMPAVLQEAKNALAVEDGGKLLKVSGTVYRIVEKERLVSAPMTWREYLFPLGVTEANLPDQSLLPKNDPERKLWEKWVEEGWNAGIDQANDEMSDRVRKLARDFRGMILYMTLLERKMINAPNVAVFNESVTGGGDKMAIRQSTYRITMPSALNPEVGDWKMIELGDRQSLRMPDELREGRSFGW